MNKDQAEALYGKRASHSEHRQGDEILVQHGTQVKHGKILHVRAPGKAVIDGDAHSLLYIVDCNEGFPEAVAPSQIIEGTPKPLPFTAILGTYGFADSALKNWREAESLVRNAPDNIIDTDHGKLRVLSARVEGDEKAGRVIAEAEAVVESEQGE